MRYVGTYFYYDHVDLGATYGNIHLPFKERNDIYWKTVFTFFVSATVYRTGETQLVLFTNSPIFPFREKLESMGVLIYDNLKLTYRNNEKWATVKFFFDVLFYIENCNDFGGSDSFILLDTDVVCINNMDLIFKKIEESADPLVYLLGDSNFEDPFHGTPIRTLDLIARGISESASPINVLVGGEFFGFAKSHLGKELVFFSKMLQLKGSITLSTEEEILTIRNCLFPYTSFDYSIYRIWSTMRFLDIPVDWRSYVFLHLPSEKEFGFLYFYKSLSKANFLKINIKSFENIFRQCFSLDCVVFLYARKICFKIFNIVWR